MVALWIHLLLEANYKEKNWKGIVLPSGTFPTSVRAISEKTGLSIQQTKNNLKKLQLTNEISIKSTNKYSLITINKWEEYQCCEENPTNKPTNKSDENQQTKDAETNNTIRNKEYKKEKNKYIVFKKPTLEEVEAYCRERNNNVDAQRFIDYYTANGWKVGRNPMKDWKATVRTWERKDKPNELPTYNTTNNIVISNEEQDEILRLMKG